MKITPVSDLHLEFGDLELENTQDADLLILGGDILIAQDLHDHRPIVSDVEQAIISKTSNLGTRQLIAMRFRNFLKRVSDRFPHVIYIAGNHEFYHGKYPDAYDYIRNEVANINNLYFLEQEYKRIDDVIFIGGTLWTDMNRRDSLTISACAGMMNDYRTIRMPSKGYAKLRPEVTIRQHNLTVNYIKRILADNPNEKTVVVGHHAPTKLSCKPKYEKDHLLNGAYSSDLSEIMLNNPQIKLWTHGHTHDCFDYTIGTCRVVCNPRGYVGYEDDPGFNPNLVIEV
jgi:Icc-related predicted phosphoesterase